LKISINTLTANAVREEVISGREFVILNAMLIRADTSMNGIYYPSDELEKTFMQLAGLPAPLGHPKRDGMHVSASDLFAKGAHEIGAFVKNVTMKGKEVHGDIFIDKEVANRSEQGKSLLHKIARKAKIGVSTGLQIAKVIVKNGVDELGKAFDSVGIGFKFDHLAILDGEVAAGAHAGTEIKFNSENANSLFVVNHDNGSQSKSNNKEVSSMKIEVDVTDLCKKDRIKLESMTANELITVVNAEKQDVTVEEAQAVLESKGLKINSADAVVLTAEQHAELTANADSFKAAEKARLDGIKEKITANSKIEAGDLDGMSEDALERFAASLVPANDFSVNAGKTTEAKDSDIALDFSFGGK
jgi:hypothetical protein